MWIKTINLWVTWSLEHNYCVVKVLYGSLGTRCTKNKSKSKETLVHLIDENIVGFGCTLYGIPIVIKKRGSNTFIPILIQTKARK